MPKGNPRLVPGSKTTEEALVREARRTHSQYTGSQEDHTCMHCGYIYDGPHTGERIAKSKVTHTGVYKGTGVSHGVCNPPCAEARDAMKPHGRQRQQYSESARRQPSPPPRNRMREARGLDRDIARARETWARSGDPKDLRRYQDLQEKRRG